MINLLPTSAKTNINYARKNTRLRNWSIIFILSIIGIGFITGIGWLYMNKSINNYNAQISRDQQSLKDQKLDETQAQVQDISSSLQLVIKVLSKEVLFSKLLNQVAKAIPNYAVLTGLQIGKVEGAIDITAKTSDYNTATQLQVNLQDPNNKIFDKADIVSITCNNGGKDPKYPCIVIIRALFSKSNPFQFINGSKS